MPVIGITGGVASGKSTVTRLLVDYLQFNHAGQVESFSADSCSHELLDSDADIRSEIHKKFGNGILDNGGKVDRKKLREVVFENSNQREVLESILHPKIRETWLTKTISFRNEHNYFVAEIPLLYETKSASYFDCIVVVEADSQVQLERLSSKRGWSLEMARRVIDAQMPAEEKRRLANILILNHHTEKLLRRQIELTATALLMRYA